MIRRYSVRLPRQDDGDQYLTTGTIEYHEASLEPPIPKSIAIIVTNEKNNSVNPAEEQLIELSVPESLTSMESFYLPHYGIDDEAVRGDSRGGLKRLGWFLLGVSALIVFWRLVSRKTNSTSKSH